MYEMNPFHQEVRKKLDLEFYTLLRIMLIHKNLLCIATIVSGQNHNI
jgi:hypothetical protein